MTKPCQHAPHARCLECRLLDAGALLAMPAIRFPVAQDRVPDRIGQLWAFKLELIELARGVDATIDRLRAGCTHPGRTATVQPYGYGVAEWECDDCGAGLGLVREGE